MRTLSVGTAFVAVFLTVAPSHVYADTMMHGSLGGLGSGISLGGGSPVILDQATGVVSVVGKPAGFARLTGISFNEQGHSLGLARRPYPFYPFPFPPAPPGPIWPPIPPNFSDRIHNPNNG